MLTKIQKSHIAERIPFFMVLVAFSAHSIFSYFDFYGIFFDVLENMVSCCTVFCIFAWLVSHEWGFVAKKSIFTLFCLNLLNIVYGIFQFDEQKEAFRNVTYYYIFGLLIFMVFASCLIYSLITKEAKT